VIQGVALFQKQSGQTLSLPAKLTGLFFLARDAGTNCKVRWL
jgi:hypothetical protein